MRHFFKPLFLMFFVALFLFGFSFQSDAEGVQGSGFLTDYSKLKPGPESDPDQSGFDFIYEKEGFDLKKYDKIMIDRVVFFLKKDAEYQGIDPDELKELADSFHQAFFDALGDDYPIVTEPGQGVLRIRSAITDLVPTKRALNLLTSVGPTGFAYSTFKRITTGVHAYVGEATLEAEFLDSETNEQLSALLDRRGSPKLNVFAGMSKWGQVKLVFEEWARMLRWRLDDAHGRPRKPIYQKIEE